MTHITMVQNKALSSPRNPIIKFILGKLLPYLGALALWLIIWQIAASRIGIELILPTPKATFLKLCEIVSSEKFAVSAVSSMRRILQGFLIGALFGVLIGAVSFFLPFAETFFSPFLKIVRATPVSSFILLVVLWISSDKVPVFIAFLMVLPIVSQNILTGLKNTSVQLKEAADMYGLSFLTRLRVLYIPAAMPYFGASCSTSLGLAWKAGIAAEVLCATRDSIGKNLYEAKLYLESAELLAWTVAVIILSVILEAAAALILYCFKSFRQRRFSRKDLSRTPNFVSEEYSNE